MLRIQIIGSDWKENGGFYGIEKSSLEKPKALDEFDVNIIDLSCESMWVNNGNSTQNINESNNLRSVYQMISNSKFTKTIYVLPKNSYFYYNMSSGRYHGATLLKDKLENVTCHILSQIITPTIFSDNLLFENTRTDIGETEYEADFYFVGAYDVLTKSKLSEKTTTITLSDRVIATTLDIVQTQEKLINFLDFLFNQNGEKNIPTWVKNIDFGDDPAQKEIIQEKQLMIEEATHIIHTAEEKLRENNKYKSILYTNGGELVSVVFEMLEKLLSCDLSTFKDVRKEDFLIQLETCTFIGEIKGVSSNVRFEHISQIELHYRSYLDKLVEENKNEKVKQLLIINPFRNKPLEDRTEIHADQISLAERNNCLIIETNTLLRVFEKFLEDQISSQQCKAVFENKNGILTLSDFENGN